jgi:uncharacterized membrane protein YhaH (DUF805 family)
MNMKKEFIIALLLVFFSMTQIMSLWWIDISFSAIASGQQLISLFGIGNPYDQYHRALMLNLFSFFFLAVLIVIQTFLYQGENK